MSIYELMDIRATHIGVVNYFFRFWVTATFALVAASFVAGSDLGWLLAPRPI